MGATLAALFVLALASPPSVEIAIVANEDSALNDKAKSEFERAIGAGASNVKVHVIPPTCDVNTMACLTKMARALEGNHPRWIARPALHTVKGRQYLELLLLNPKGFSRVRLTSAGAKDAMADVVAAVTQETGYRRIAFLPIQSDRLDAVERRGLESSILLAAGYFPALTLVPPSDTAAHVEAAQALEPACKNPGSTKCQVMIAKLASSVATLKLSLSLEGGREMILAESFDLETQESQSKNQTQSLNTFVELLGDFYGDQKTGSLLIEEVRPGLIYIDDRPVGRTPSSTPSAGIQTGTRTLRVMLEDGTSWTTKVKIEPAVVNKVAPLIETEMTPRSNLPEDPTPRFEPAAERNASVFFGGISFIGQWTPGDQARARAAFESKAAAVYGEDVLFERDILAKVNAPGGDCRSRECAQEAASVLGSRAYLVTELARAGNNIELKARWFDSERSIAQKTIALRSITGGDDIWDDFVRELALVERNDGQGFNVLGTALTAGGVALTLAGGALMGVGLSGISNDDTGASTQGVLVGSGIALAALGLVGVGVGVGVLFSE